MKLSVFSFHIVKTPPPHPPHLSVNVKRCSQSHLRSWRANQIYSLHRWDPVAPSAKWFTVNGNRKALPSVAEWWELIFECVYRNQSMNACIPASKNDNWMLATFMMRAIHYPPPAFLLIISEDEERRGAALSNTPTPNQHGDLHWPSVNNKC